MPPVLLRLNIKSIIMRQVFVVYETDAWHSHSSRQMAGVFTSKRSAINAIVKNHHIKLSEIFEVDDLKNTSHRVLRADARRILRRELELMYQTQGYSTNYVIEIRNFNEWDL